MKGSKTLRGVGVLAVAAAGFWGSGLAVGGTVSSFVGSYQGFFFDQVDGQNGPFTFTMTEVENNQADAVLTAGAETTPFHVTIGESNVFNAVGTGPVGFRAHGNITEFGDGSSIERSHYILRHGEGGTLEKGVLIFLQSFPADGAAQLPATLTGSFVRDDGQTGELSVSLTQQGSEFQGTGSFGGLAFPFVGTVGGAGGTAPVHAISVSDLATITIDGTWSTSPGPELDGSVNITFADGSVHTATFTLEPSIGTSG